MKFRIFFFGAICAVLIVIPNGRGSAQDIPGFSLGAFYEYRVENEIADEDLTFNYYGLRIAFRDERWVELFVDAGVERIDFEPIESDDTGGFGIGGTFWLLRGEYGYSPLDVGVYGSYHFADYEPRLKDGSGQSEVKHHRYLVQGILRGRAYGNLKPYLRLGVLGTKLEPDSLLFEGQSRDETAVAVNVGVELELSEMALLTLEGNYSESVGAAIHLRFWF